MRQQGKRKAKELFKKRIPFQNYPTGGSNSGRNKSNIVSWTYKYFTRHRQLKYLLPTLLIASIFSFGSDIITNILGNLFADWIVGASGNWIGSGIFIFMLVLLGIIFTALARFVVRGIDHDYPKLFLTKTIRWLLSIALGIFLSILTTFSVVARLDLGIIKSRTDLPKEDDSGVIGSTPTPFRPICNLINDVFPCIYIVREKNPRETLCEIAGNVYQIDGFVDPIYCVVICQTNSQFLATQFRFNVPDSEKSVWDNDPCNYIVPGNELWIPSPPIIQSGG